jgi:hypothetical protein
MALCGRADVVGDDTLERNEAKVLVFQRDGAVLQGHADLSDPVTDLDLTWGRLRTKFRGLAEPIVGPEKTERMIDIVSNLENADSLTPLLEASAP